MRKRLTEEDLLERLEQAEMRAEDLAQEYANLSCLRREHEAEIGVLERCLEEVGRLFGLTAGDNELWASDLTRRIVEAIEYAQREAQQVAALRHEVANLQTTISGYKALWVRQGLGTAEARAAVELTPTLPAVADATGCGS